jgi:crossover junction endodeoxyribonuclease RusA
VNVFVPGRPIPQGSTKAYLPKGHSRPIVTADNTKTKPWRADIQAHTRAVVGPHILIPTAPVELALVFVMPRRAAEPKRNTPPHTRKPDLDKLIRAVLDALTGIVFTDDAQVVQVYASKRTAAIGEQPGVEIRGRQQPVAPDRHALPPAPTLVNNPLTS